MRDCERERAALASERHLSEAARRSDSAPSRTPGLALLGSGAGLALVGMGFGLGARSEAAQVSQTGSVQRPAPFAQVADSESRGELYQTLSYVFYGLGAGAALTGVVLEIVPPKKKTSLRVIPAGAGAMLRGTF